MDLWEILLLWNSRQKLNWASLANTKASQTIKIPICEEEKLASNVSLLLYPASGSPVLSKLKMYDVLGSEKTKHEWLLSHSCIHWLSELMTSMLVATLMLFYGNVIDEKWSKYWASSVHLLKLNHYAKGWKFYKILNMFLSTKQKVLWFNKT